MTRGILRWMVILAAFVAPFFFPFPFTLLLAFLASLFVPPVALGVGVLVDLLYYSSGLPTGTVWGLGLFILGFFVRRFIKARIIGG